MKSFLPVKIMLGFIFVSCSIAIGATDVKQEGSKNYFQELLDRIMQKKNEQKPSSPTPEESKKPLKVKTRDWGEEFESVAQVYQQVSEDRKELHDLREKHIAEYKNIRLSPNPDYSLIANNISNDMIKYIQKRIAETFAKMGRAPTTFCIFSMGSLARKESCFFTDLEIGILVKAKNIEVEKYFEKFTQILADRFFLLGEHPDVGGKGLRIDEADNAPIHMRFYARYASDSQAKGLLKQALDSREFDKIPFEGSRLYIATPAEFAQHLDRSYTGDQSAKASREQESKLFAQEMERALANPKNADKSKGEIAEEVGALVRTLVRPLTSKEKGVSHSITGLVRNIIFLYGEKSLFSDYIKKRDVYLNGPAKIQNPLYDNRRQEIAYINMKDNVTKYIKEQDSAIPSGVLGEEVDLKREIYRFPEQMLTSLGFWYNVGEQNTIKIIEKLVETGVMSASFGAKLSDLMNFCLGLRLKKQEIMRKQGKSIPVTIQRYEDIKADLEEERAALQLVNNFLVKTYAPAKEIEAIHDKIRKIDTSLIDLKKQIPEGENSILDKQTIELLNTKYLPILKELYHAGIEFLSGDKKAFMINK